ncbi:ornithine cyclodeaminase [Serratia sp. M24T3]|uniref:ornithine cyclodeaminase n=1 Tax=Serratia sp. M24T3 TaxID=932213 RepID=UPI00025BA696|nr:ornithine cyclodeaminase [Serratia sp. M24T3]EIC85287.1 ornithine cyclodeaminase [Serratia sp. M24T3]
MSAGFRYLSQQDVDAAGGNDAHQAWQDVCDVVTLMRQGQAEMPAETHVRLAGDRGKAYALPARVGGRFNAAGVKWTAHRPDADDGLPQAMALTLINRADNGLPLGLVESGSLTAARTAAVTAVALRHAAPRKLKRVLLLGAGVQARAHLHMLSQLFPDLQRVDWWHRNPQKIVLADWSATWPLVQHAELSPLLAQEFDAVITCTSAAQPIVDSAVIKPGRLVVQVGYHEVNFAAIKQADRVVVDLWGDFCATSAKSLFQMYRAGEFNAGQVDADLSNLLIDGWHPAADDCVYFSSFGLNVFDIALASRVLACASDLKLGTLLPLFPEAPFSLES